MACYWKMSWQKRGNKCGVLALVTTLQSSTQEDKPELSISLFLPLCPISWYSPPSLEDTKQSPPPRVALVSDDALPQAGLCTIQSLPHRTHLYHVRGIKLPGHSFHRTAQDSNAQPSSYSHLGCILCLPTPLNHLARCGGGAQQSEIGDAEGLKVFQQTWRPSRHLLSAPSARAHPLRPLRHTNGSGMPTLTQFLSDDELTELIAAFPKAEFAFAYGSGVVQQKASAYTL